VLGVIIVGGVLFYRFMRLAAPIPADVGAEYAGLPRGYTDQGFPRLGNPDATIVVEEFLSFACPHCREFHEQWFPALLSQIASGQVQFVVVPVSSIGWGAGSAAKGALCAGEQGKFWEMHDVLFDWQKRFITSTFNERRIRKGAKNMGLDTVAFDACMSENHPKAALDAALSEFHLRGLPGTPTLFINGEQVRDYRELENLSDRLPHEAS
jgi:protein-disulfide isomerase